MKAESRMVITPGRHEGGSIKGTYVQRTKYFQKTVLDTVGLRLIKTHVYLKIAKGV